MYRNSLFVFCIAFWIAGGLACSGGESKPNDSTPNPTVSPGSSQEPAPEPKVAKKAQPLDKKVLMVIAPEDFRDEELFDTRKTLEAAGIAVSLASLDTKEAKGMLGGKATPDISISNVDIGAFDAIVFIGGSGAKVLVNNEKILSLAKNAKSQGKIVAAICMAPEILANAGLLEGKKATSWKGSLPNLKAKGAVILDEPVVISGRIITGSGPEASVSFGAAIVQSLLEE